MVEREYLLNKCFVLLTKFTDAHISPFSIFERHTTHKIQNVCSRYVLNIRYVHLKYVEVKMSPCTDMPTDI